VQVLAGLRLPEVVGVQKDAVHHTFIVPREGQQIPDLGGFVARRHTRWTPWMPSVRATIRPRSASSLLPGQPRPSAYLSPRPSSRRNGARKMAWHGRAGEAIPDPVLGDALPPWLPSTVEERRPPAEVGGRRRRAAGARLPEALGGGGVAAGP
jgi:hypothetical protein